MKGYFIRKQNWINLLEDFNELKVPLKQQAYFYYNRRYKNIITTYKQRRI